MNQWQNRHKYNNQKIVEMQKHKTLKIYNSKFFRLLRRLNNAIKGQHEIIEIRQTNKIIGIELSI